MIMGKSLNLMKTVNPLIQEAQRTSSTRNKENATQAHFQEITEKKKKEKISKKMESISKKTEVRKDM